MATELLRLERMLAPVDSGKISTPIQAGQNSLSDQSKMWQANILVDHLVRVTDHHGRREVAVVAGNAGSSIIIRGSWQLSFPTGSDYEILTANLIQVLRDVLGGGFDISAANPLPVDTSPGLKTTQQILTIANLAAGATSLLAQCTSLDLRSGPASLALTVVATYNAAAVRGLRVHVRTSPDDANFDSEDWDAWDAGFTAGATLRETEVYHTDPMYLRVLVENLDGAQAITGIAVIVSVGA